MLRKILKMKQGYDLDDLLIIPKDSNVNSRNDVDIRTEISDGYWLDVPIVASPMKGIVGTKLIIELGMLGGLGILHRFYLNNFDRAKDIYRIEKSGINYGIAISSSKTELGFLHKLLPHLSNIKVICVDVANGYTNYYGQFIQSLSDYLYSVGRKSIVIMSGNVATGRGFEYLLTSGSQLVRIGIGQGRLCSTRNKTGVGVPQASAIIECRAISEGILEATLIADGGIKYPGQAVKALALGADLIMVGTKLAETFESENNGTVYGMASLELQEQMYNDIKSIEGISKKVGKTLSLKDYVDDIKWSIKSACTYVEASNLEELRKNSEFIIVGGSSIDHGRI